MMFFPAVANSRYNSHLNACQNNLRVFGAALPLWAENSFGKLPYIPPRGKTGVAGFYAPQLMDAGFIKEHSTFVCPSSRLSANQSTFFVPEIETIQRARGAKLVAIQRRMGGSYCYNLGHFEGGQHRPTQVRSRTHFAVMSDHVFLPGSNQQVRIHGLQGINVLFEDGHVRFILLQPKKSTGQDASGFDHWSKLFVSDRGIVEAGVNVDDAVLAPSWVRPIPGEGDWGPHDLEVDTIEL